MKQLLQLIFLLTLSFISAQKQNSKIDSIKTEQDAENLIRSFGENYKYFKIQKISDFKEEFGSYGYCEKIADSLNLKKSFYKADFDHNGLTDILVIGNYYDFNIFIVLDFGDNNLKLNRLTRDHRKCTFPVIKENSLIDYYFMSQPLWFTKEEPKLLKRQLVYHFDDFIEYNAELKKYNIEKIEYRATMCFGTCPAFYITIEKDRKGTLKADGYNINPLTKKEIKGKFNAKIDIQHFNEIINLLNYLDFPNLEDNYSISVTDYPTSYLTITYDNGKTKSIKDYGQNGTFGLRRVYKFFSDLRFNQDWKE